MQVFRESGRYLGMAIASIVNAIDPEVVVLTGGMSGAHRFFMETLKAAFRAGVFPPARDAVRIEIGTLGGDAGIIGAALVALYKAGRTE
jgi:glucokinase